MALDPVTNFARVTVVGGYDNAATSIQLQSGDGAKLPNPAMQGNFNLIWWNATDYPNPTDDPFREIVRASANSGDVLTVARNQESSGASVKNIAGKSYKMILSLTAKTMSDISTSLHKPWNTPIALVGLVNGMNRVYTITGNIVPGDASSATVYLVRQPQLQVIDWVYSAPGGIPTITYNADKIPDASLSGLGHYITFQ